MSDDNRGRLNDENDGSSASPKRVSAPRGGDSVRPATQVLTRGFDPRLSVGSARPAVFRSSTYVFSSPEAAERAFAVALGKSQRVEGEEIELIYSRLSHPNAEILEDQIVPLEEGGSSAAVFNSGMAAISTLFFTLCRPGESIVFTVPVYGGTHHLLRQVLEPFGIVLIPVPAGDRDALCRAIESAQDLSVVFIETPANPTLRMSDIAAAVDAADLRPDRPIVAIDNTFMGPVFQHPIALGADLSIYSATKYLAGFSDMLGGVAIGRDPALIDRLRASRALLGNILQPDECWLLDSRLATVSLRMNRQSKNASRIVAEVAKHPLVERIHYPNYRNSPQYPNHPSSSDPPNATDDREQQRIYASQCDYPGGIFSMVLKGGKRAAFEFLRRLSITKNAVSLGGVESLACHPATTTHSEMTPEELEQAGVAPGLIRVSVGIEDWADLLLEYTTALDAIQS